MRTHKIFFIPALLMQAILSGCATSDSGDPDYVFTAPENENAKACIAQCTERNNACRAHEDEQASQGYKACRARTRESRQNCEREAEASYNRCLKKAQGQSTPEKKKKKAKKPKTEKERKALEKKEKAERLKLEQERERIAKAMDACERAECPAAPKCYDDPAYGLCDSDFRVCYQGCGGQVEFKRRMRTPGAYGVSYSPAVLP